MTDDQWTSKAAPPSDRARGHYTNLEYHRRLLDDDLRTCLYERAIRALVQPGDVVLDLGCGTGILAMLAARRGAERVHAVESTPIAGLAAELVSANGLADRVFVHHLDALEMEPVEPVDLIVSDFMGRYLIDDHMLPVVAASARWLKPGGRFCPQRIRLFLAPAGDFFFNAVDFFRDPIFGLDFQPAQKYTMNFSYHVRLSSAALMAAEREYALYVPPTEAPPFDGSLEFELKRDGRLQGFIGWFEASLCDGVTLSTEPGADNHWNQYLFPVPPLEARAGDRVAIRLWEERTPLDSIWHWQGDVRRGDRELMTFDLESEQRLGHRRDCVDAGSEA